MKRMILAAGVLLVLCAAVAAADKPADPLAAERVGQLKAGIDHFKLIIRYYGEQGDERLYNVTLDAWDVSVGAHAKRPDPFWPYVKISKTQALKIIACLDQSGVIGKAMDYSRKDGGPDYPKLDGPCYALRMQVDGVDYFCDIGWNADMLAQLDGLRKALDGDAAKGMDKLLGALARQRKEWETAEKAAPVAAERKAWLVENVKSFRLSLQYMGAVDPKAPLYSMVLSTTPIERLAIPVANSDVVIDEKQALKIIDWLEKDGFLANTVLDADKFWVGPCYLLQVAAGGHRLQQSLGWNLDTFKRMDALMAVLDGDAAKAMQRVLDSVADARKKMETAERVKKLKGDLDLFVLMIAPEGPLPKKPLNWLVISTQAMMYGKRGPGGLDALVTKEEALKIIGWLEKDGFFERGQEALDREVAHPIYMMTVRGAGGLKFGEDIGWGRPLLDKLESLRGALNADAAAKLDTLAAALKAALPPPEKADVAPIPEDPKTAAERVKMLKGDLGSFSVTLQFYGGVDPKAPRWSFTLSTKPVLRLATPVAHSDVVIDEKQALKIIEQLEKDGFFERAADGYKSAQLTTAAYVLSVAGNGQLLGENLGWSPETFRRIDSLARVLEGQAAEAMQKVQAGVKSERAKMEAAERVKKIKGDLDHFEMSLYYEGPQRRTVFYSLTFATRAKEYGARAAYSLDAVVTRDEALKIIAWLEKDGFFEQEDEVVDRPVALPAYMLTVKGGGVNLWRDIGWGRPLLDRLDSLRVILSPEAADQLGKLMTAVKKALPPESADPVPEKAAAPAAPAKETEKAAEAPRMRIAAERAKTLKANLKDFNLTLQYQGPAPAEAKPYYMMQLFTNPAVRRTVPANLLLAQIDEETAGKIVDYLATTDVLDRAHEIISTHAAEPMGPAGQSYVLYVGRYQDFLVFGKELDTTLNALRALLTGEAAKQMDLLMDRAGVKRDAPVAAARAKALKADLDNFVVTLAFRGAQDKPLYLDLTLLTNGFRANGIRTPEKLVSMIDKETATKLIDRLADTGVLAQAWDPRDAQARKVRPNPHYVVDITGGELTLEGDLGWGKDLADQLTGLRAPLTGDAGKQMDVLIGRLSGYWKEWTGAPYEPPK